MFSRCRYIRENKLKSFAKKALSHMYYSFLLRTPERPQSTPPENSIAVVFLAALGDLIVFCDAARKLSASGKDITLVCRRGNGTADFARMTGLFHRVTEVDIDGKARAKNLGMLKELQVDTVFCAPLGRHILPDMYACAIRAEHRFFPDTLLDCTLPSLKRRVDRYADKLVPITETHELKRYTQFLSQCGLISEPVRPFTLDRPAVRRGSTLAVFPGAGGGEEKQWGVRNFAAVVSRLLENGLAEKAVILGTQSDSRCCGELFRLIQHSGNAENLCGATTIGGLTEILRGCSLAMANDSAGAHLGIACGTPTIVVCGMWQHGRFFPDAEVETPFASLDDSERFCQTCDSSRPRCGVSPAPCLKGVTADRVFDRAAGLLTKERN